jgi:hypothetical protein
MKSKPYSISMGVQQCTGTLLDGRPYDALFMTIRGHPVRSAVLRTPTYAMHAEFLEPLWES